MKHFIDKLNTVSKQTFDTAVIVDAKGKPAGKIVIRYTDAQIGYNNETGVLLYGYDLDFSTTRKGNTYSKMNAYHMLREIGARVYDFGGHEFIGYQDKAGPNTRNYDSTSNVKDIDSFKIGNRKFSVLWV